MKPAHYLRYLNTIASGPDRFFPRTRPWSRPLRIHLAINDYCNIRCPHCLRHLPSTPVDRGRLGVEDLRRIAPWFRLSQYVALAGLGEPFIQKDIFDVIHFIESFGPSISVITNGTLINEKTALELTRCRQLLLNLSFDAATPSVFEALRLGAKFDEVVANMDRLAALKKKRNATFPILNINMTLMRDNLGEVEGVLRHAARWGALQLTAQTVWLPEGAPDPEQRIANRDAQKAMAEAEPLAKELGIALRYVPLSSDYDSLMRDQEEDDLFAPTYPYQKRRKAGVTGRFFCPILWHQLFIDVTGEMMYCCIADQEFHEAFGDLGRIQDHAPAALWNHPKVVALRKRLAAGDPPKECRACYALENHTRRQAWDAWRSDFEAFKYF